MSEFRVRGKDFDKLVFVHLTKTAGGTLKEAIANEPSFSPVFLYNEKDWSKYDRSFHNVIYGHPNKWMFGKIGKDLDSSGDRFAYITFLRHPVTRTISHYYHLRNVDQGEVGDRIRSYSSIDDFFANDFHWEFSDFFCKMFSNSEHIRANVDMERRFEEAKNTIENCFSFVGFQESFDLSVLVLNVLLGRNLRIQQNINVGGYSSFGIKKETLRKIVLMNEYDLRLYKRAQRFLGREFLRSEVFVDEYN